MSVTTPPLLWVSRDVLGMTGKKFGRVSVNVRE
jgi:hypothetical protein